MGLNIADRIARQAELQPHARAVVVAEKGRGLGKRQQTSQISFGQLQAEIELDAKALRLAGIKPGMRCLMLVTSSIELFSISFALFRLGAVPVFVDPAMGRKGLINAISQVEAEAFIGVPKAHIAKFLMRRAFRSVKIAIKTGRCLMPGFQLSALEAEAKKIAEPAEASTQASDLAAVLFTSGSTGPAKGVLYTHGIFDNQVAIMEKHFGVGRGDVDLASFPLFSFFSAALGATVILPDMDPSHPADCDGAVIARTIREQGVTFAFGSPAFWPRVAEACEDQGLTLPSMRRIFMAGAHVPVDLLTRVKRLLPEDAEIYTPYGATECLPVTLPKASHLLAGPAERTLRGMGNCVGQPIEGTKVRILQITDEAIPSMDAAQILEPNQVGEIVVHSPVMTEHYFRRPLEEAKAKVLDGARVWHRMGDVGYLDDAGELWFCGRKSQRVETEAGPMYTVCIEAILNQHPKVRRSALVGLGERFHQTPVIVIETWEDARPTSDEERTRLADELFELGEKNVLSRPIEDILFHPGFPVDARHNAKIRREALTEWAETMLR